MNSKPQALLLLSGAVLCWSVSCALGKLTGWDLLSFNAGRCLVSFIIAAAIWGRPRRSWLHRSVVSGAIAYAVNTSTFLAALLLGPAENAIAIMYAAPIFTAAWCVLIRKEQVSRRQWLESVIVVFGVAVISYARAEFGLGATIVALVSAVAYAALVLIRRDQSRIEAQQSVVLGFLISVVASVALLAARWCFTNVAPTIEFTTAEVGYIVGYGLLSCLGFVFIVRAAKAVSPVTLIVFTSLETVLGPAMVWVVTGALPTAFGVVGGSLIVLASISVSIRMLKKVQPSGGA